MKGSSGMKGKGKKGKARVGYPAKILKIQHWHSLRPQFSARPPSL